MTKCPIMSKQNESHIKIYCFEDECAFWDEKMKMCCIKSAALAVAGNKGGESSPTAQAYYISPSSYCQTDAISNKIIDDSYQLTRNVPIAPVLRERGL